MTRADLVDTLTQLAGGRGTLSARELRQVVPVETMRVEELAALIDELDARGVTVEIDPALLSGARSPSPQARVAAADHLHAAAAPPMPPPRSAAASSGSPSAPSSPARASATPPASQRAVAIAVLAAAVIVVVLIALVWAF